jgi:hypothetical protein
MLAISADPFSLFHIYFDILVTKGRRNNLKSFRPALSSRVESRWARSSGPKKMVETKRPYGRPELRTEIFIREQYN